MKTLEVTYSDYKFIIEEDLPEVGTYLYVFKDGKSVNDFLQKNVETRMELAYEKYNLPIKDWPKP